MINENFIQKLKDDYDQREGERRQIISLSNVVLHDSKRVIFALHRNEIDKAGESLNSIEETLRQLASKFGAHRLQFEGAYKAGVEEYVEAKMFFRYLTGEKIDEIEGYNFEAESYLSGLSDLTGEMVRLAINQAAAGKLDQPEEIKQAINELMTKFVEFDMTGYLRTKYDQAKTNLRKIEQICYEIKIREK